MYAFLQSVEPFGKQVKRARRAHNMTQLQLSQKSFCSLSLVRKVEQGRRRITPDVARAFSQVLGLQFSA